MAFFQKILHKLNGIRYRQEYLCIPLGQHAHPLYAFLVSDNIAIKDITTLYSMVGICPLIFALPALDELDLDVQDKINIVYSAIPLKIGSAILTKNSVAELCLKRIKIQRIGQYSIYYFEGERGRHNFLSFFNQFVIRLNNRLYNKKKGNIFLEGNLYTQIQIVYSIPQVISLITVGSDNLYNVFPTDQHGQITDEHYVITLRHAGKACKQVEATKRIVLSNIEASYYKEVYSFGKNHMQPPKEKSNFDFSETQSQILNLPLPRCTIEYRELELQDFFIHGIHKVLLFKILSHQTVSDKNTTLACINNVYATWRYKNNLPNNYFVNELPG
jgi:hypothetical protein